MPPAPLGWREGSVMRHLLLRQKTVPGDDPSHDLTQTPSIRRRETLPEWRSRRLLRRLGLSRVAGGRGGGAFGGVAIQPLLCKRPTDAGTTETTFTRPVTQWCPPRGGEGQG